MLKKNLENWWIYKWMNCKIQWKVLNKKWKFNFRSVWTYLSIETYWKILYNFKMLDNFELLIDVLNIIDQFEQIEPI